jgi:hypothetical protein
MGAGEAPYAQLIWIETAMFLSQAIYVLGPLHLLGERSKNRLQDLILDQFEGNVLGPRLRHLHPLHCRFSIIARIWNNLLVIDAKICHVNANSAYVKSHPF